VIVALDADGTYVRVRRGDCQLSTVSEDIRVAKKPAQPLPPDPNRRRGIRYPGLYVIWWDDGTWEWIKCVNCGSELTTQKSRQQGCGSTCALVVTEAMKDARLREERINARAYLEEKARSSRWRSKKR